MEVKDYIRQRRIELDMTMKELGKAVGVSEGTISRWESGGIENMKRDKIAALARALHTDPGILMGWTGVPEDHVSGQPEWYTNPEVAEIAQTAFESPDLRMLFDLARDADPEDIRLAIEMLRRMKGTNPDG